MIFILGTSSGLLSFSLCARFFYRKEKKRRGKLITFGSVLDGVAA